MNENESMVQDEGLQAEDLLSEELVEEPQDESISLEEALTDEGQTADTDEQESEPQSGRKEPGYVQQRINKALAKARAEWQAELDSQMAPLREYQMEMEAQKLVDTGKVKDLETAKELVRYRQGRPQPQAEAAPTQQNEATDTATQARIAMLQHQADRIRANNGPDVIAEFKNNPEVKQKLVSGEWDFEDVANYMRGNSGGKKIPSPMRSPNGANSASHNFDLANMSSEQFAKLEKRIQEGARISLKQ